MSTVLPLYNTVSPQATNLPSRFSHLQNEMAILGYLSNSFQHQIMNALDQKGVMETQIVS